MVVRRVERRSNMCVERLASSLRMAMRRTARFLTRPVEAHFSQMSHHSPRLMRRVVDTPWSPRSQQRRLYTKQKSFFAGHKRNSSSRSLNDLDIDTTKIRKKNLSC